MKVTLNFLQKTEIDNVPQENLNNINFSELLLMGKSGIKIKKSNEGKFTNYCGGKVTDDCIRQAKNSKDPALRKRAVFAENARKWKHKDGGTLNYIRMGKDGFKTFDASSVPMENLLPGIRNIDISKAFVDMNAKPSDWDLKQQEIQSFETPKFIIDDTAYLGKSKPTIKEEALPETKEDVPAWLTTPYVNKTKTEEPIAETPSVKGTNIGRTLYRKGIYADTEEGKRQFVKDLNDAFLRAGVQNEDLRKILVAQNALESGWGAKSKGGGDYNYGNLTTGRYWSGNYREAYDHDAAGNRIIQKFRSYDSLDDFVKDKIKFVGVGTRYGVDFNKDDAMAYIDKIVKSGYAADPSYRTSLTRMYNSINSRWS